MDKPDLSLFPAEPGVYLFKDASGRILYVGKARRLRQRLSSYFRDRGAQTAKTRVMLDKARSVDILRTATEKEALLLEASLIKKHRPRYNILLRDDKEYLLFRIGGSHPFPKVELMRRNQRRGKDRGERWYGPFSSGYAARETWRLIHKHFPLRRCRDVSFTNRTRPCLYHDMGQCLAPCVLPVPREDYRRMLGEVALILKGKSRQLVDGLRREMAQASEEMRFEDAALLRDRLRAVESTLERQSVVLGGRRTLDLIGLAQLPDGLALGVVFVRDGLLLDGRNFFWPGLAVEDTPELLAGFLSQFYLDRQGLGESIPPRVVVPWRPEAFAPEAEAGSAPASDSLPVAALVREPDGPATAALTTTGPATVVSAATGLAATGLAANGPGAAAADITGQPLPGLTEGGGPDPVPGEIGEPDDSPSPARAEPDGLTRAEAAEPEEHGLVLVSEDAGEDGSGLSFAGLEAALAELRGGAVHISRPRDADEDRLVLLAASNAREAVKSRARESLAGVLARRFRTARPIRRIECVDISHTGGSQTRAGMVVFEDEQPVKSDYRTYALDDNLVQAGAESGDDYAALAAWAARRAAGDAPWPDLILVDGGKGQLAAVYRALTGAGARPGLEPGDDFVLASIAKARDDEGRADRRAGNVGDRIFLPGRSNPLNFNPGSPELLFLQRVRDTAHDFVIGRHRQARAAATLSGELTRLPGVGPKLARRLFDAFGSLAAMAEAGQDALAAVPGIGRSRAEMIAARLAMLVGKKGK